VKRTIVVLCVVFLALSLTAFAAEKNGIFTSPDGRMTYAPMGKAGINHPGPANADPLLFELLDPQAKGRYFCCSGWTLSGPSSVIGAEIWDAQQFTPASNSHATGVQFAIGYVTGTYTHVIISINADCSGIPCSTALWSKKVKLTNNFGACCGINGARLKTPLALTAGTPYWVVASTESTSDIWAAWNVQVLDAVDSSTWAQYSSGAWHPISDIEGTATNVAGTVP